MPRGAGHTFGNRSEEPARLLVLHAPAMDAYFAELDALWSGRRAAGAGGRARADEQVRDGARLARPENVGGLT